MPLQPGYPRRRRRVDPETPLPLEPEVAGMEISDRLGSPEAEVGSRAPAEPPQRPSLEGDRRHVTPGGRGGGRSRPPDQMGVSGP